MTCSVSASIASLLVRSRNSGELHLNVVVFK